MLIIIFVQDVISLPAVENPIVKKPLGIANYDAELHVDD
jgi:hypothetical protein